MLPSVSGSADEAAFPDHLIAALREIPAFAAKPELVWRIPVQGSAFPRACVVALARGAGPTTVVLTGHFDTVSIEDYGDLKSLALQSDDLKEGLIRRLRAHASNAAERRALADLSGPEFLPGRGMLDMKAGLAAGLAVIESFLGAEGRYGNLLFLGVPDEEVNSAGARAAAPQLAALAHNLGLNIVAAINLDAIADDHDGATGRAVALGTIGKLLPSAFVVGQPAHAGYAFNGLGACALAGALAAEVEWAPELTDRTGSETGAGPSLLGMKDSKQAYDVTTPTSVWMYWNVSTHRRSAENVIDTLKALIARALGPLLNRLSQNRAMAGYSGELAKVEVLTFEELRREVAVASPASVERLALYAKELAGQSLDLPEQCRLITGRLWELSGRMHPAVILGFASTPYLPTSLGEDKAAQILLEATRTAAAAVAAAHDTSITLAQYFLGISDMSFIGQADESSIPAIAANTPAWGAGLAWPDGPAFAGIPVINAGPWGRDYHTVLERLHAPYAFKVLPDLIARISLSVLDSYKGDDIA
jgi:arginine utilization protein RocB